MARFPEGVPIRLLIEQPELRYFKKRTLQRRLDPLVANGQLLAKGAGRGAYYILPHPAETPASRLNEPDGNYQVPSREEPEGDWLSAAAKELRAAINRPLATRQAAPYDDSLLRDYRPNVTT